MKLVKSFLIPNKFSTISTIKIDRTYWLEYEKTKICINNGLIDKYLSRLNKNLQETIRTDEYFHDFSFDNEVDDKLIENFKSKIDKMEKELEKVNPLAFLNFEKIRTDKTIYRIQIVHSLFSFYNSEKDKKPYPIISGEINDTKNANIVGFLEQFRPIVKSKGIQYKDSVRIFYFFKSEKKVVNEKTKENITLFPLFIDAKHQIIPSSLSQIEMLEIFIGLMVNNNVKTLDDLKNVFHDNRTNKNWIDKNEKYIENLKKFYKYQKAPELWKFKLNDYMEKFIKNFFKEYDITRSKKRL